MTDTPAQPLENSCGTCVVCCFALRIDDGFEKKAGTLCPHCTKTGCGIYETRYEVCRGFLCGWRMVPQLGEAWRPDRSGVLIQSIELTEVPEEHRVPGTQMGLNFIILGGDAAILRPGFADYICTLVTRGVAVYLSADSAKTLINPFLRDRVAAKDRPAILKMLLHIYHLHIEQRRMVRKDPNLEPISLPPELRAKN